MGGEGEEWSHLWQNLTITFYLINRKIRKNKASLANLKVYNLFAQSKFPKTKTKRHIQLFI